MKNKKSLIIIFLPIILILILVIFKSLNKDNFSLDTKQTHEISLNQEYILSINQLKEKLKASQKTVLVDLRNKDDYAKAHIKNAINIPLSEILNNQEFSKLKSTDNVIVLYSNSVTQSAKAWTLLTQMGYREFFLLDIPSAVISEELLEKDTVFDRDEVLKYKFQPATAAGLE